MNTIVNLDLLSVGLAIAGIGVLGFTVFFNNRQSITNKTFLFLAIAVILWSSVNYLFYKFTIPNLSLLFLRLEIFSAVWFAFFIFQLLYVFPKEKAEFSKSYKFILIPLALITSILGLTPLIFIGLKEFSLTGGVPVAEPNLIGIIFFGVVVLGFNLSGVVLLIRKTLAATGIEKKQFRTVLIGIITTLVLIIIFNFILPAFLNIQSFVPLGAVFILPFIALTYYAIVRHKLLNVKVISTEILAFLLAIVTFSEIIISRNFAEVLFRSGEFILILIFGILLIRSVLHEVEQREELERLDKILEDKNRQLEDLSRFKSQLLSLASHQIRSPLAAIKGFVQLIMSGSYGPVEERAKEALAKVQHSADELIGLINTLLDMRKVDEGKMDYQFAKTDLAKLVADIFDLLKPLADAKKLDFTFVSPGHEVWVNADAEKLKQVVQNLADNAIKYTPSGFVKLELAEKDGAATVTVSDSGVGIPADLVPHLFEEFVRDERVKKEIRGTGLGLYIARKIAEAHGGKIWAQSAGEGKGSAFHVSVPVIK